MAELTKAQKDEKVRAFGIERIDLEGLTPIAGNMWIGEADNGRFFEIKVVAKSEKFTSESLQEILDERAETAKRKKEAKEKADKKKKKDAEKRAENSE